MANDCHFSARPLHFLGNQLLLCSKGLKFSYLKKLLLILSIILVTTHQTNAQIKSGPVTNVGVQTSILRFYPNPATTVITFDFQKGYDKGFSIQIYSLIGRKMLEQNNFADHTTVNLTEFNRGVYIYKLFDKAGKLVETGKFQVSK